MDNPINFRYKKDAIKPAYVAFLPNLIENQAFITYRRGQDQAFGISVRYIT